MGSPIPVILILCGYLVFVLKLGPHLMSKRDALKINKLLVAFNAYQMLFSVWLFSQVGNELYDFLDQKLIFKNCHRHFLLTNYFIISLDLVVDQ